MWIARPSQMTIHLSRPGIRESLIQRPTLPIKIVSAEVIITAGVYHVSLLWLYFYFSFISMTLFRLEMITISIETFLPNFIDSELPTVLAYKIRPVNLVTENE